MMLDPLLVQVAWRHRRPAVATICLQLAVTVSHLPQAVVFAFGLVALVRGDTRGVVLALAAVTSLVTARAGLTWLQARAARRLGAAVRGDLRDAALAGALVPAALHDPARRDGALRATLVDGVDGVDAYITRYLPAVAQVVVLVPAVALLLSVIHPLAGAAAGAAAAGAVLIPIAWKKALARRSSGHWDTYEALGGDLLEALRGMTTLRLSGTVQDARARLSMRSDALHEANVRVMRLSLVDTALIDLAVQAGAVAAVALAVADAAGGGTPALTAYLVLLLSGEVFRPVRELSRAWHAGYLGTSAVGALRRLGVGGRADSPRRISGDDTSEAGRATRLPVVLEDLRFSYPGTARPVVDGVDATFEVGGVTAVVGPSGAGKSTLLDLVLGHLTPSSGSVHCGGLPLRADDVAVVTQRPVLFEGSVRENLSVGRPTATDDELLQACVAAAVLDEVLAMPGGLDARIAMAGGNVSGGQRQRLALARAIVANRPVLLADEPTSALDPAAARAVACAFAALARDRVVIVVAHREESLEGVEKVLELVDGRLVPAGAVVAR